MLAAARREHLAVATARLQLQSRSKRTRDAAKQRLSSRAATQRQRAARAATCRAAEKTTQRHKTQLTRQTNVGTAQAVPFCVRHGSRASDWIADFPPQLLLRKRSGEGVG